MHGTAPHQRLPVCAGRLNKRKLANIFSTSLKILCLHTHTHTRIIVGKICVILQNV